MHSPPQQHKNVHKCIHFMLCVRKILSKSKFELVACVLVSHANESNIKHRKNWGKFQCCFTTYSCEWIFFLCFASFEHSNMSVHVYMYLYVVYGASYETEFFNISWIQVVALTGHPFCRGVDRTGTRF